MSGQHSGADLLRSSVEAAASAAKERNRVHTEARARNAADRERSREAFAAFIGAMGEAGNPGAQDFYLGPSGSVTGWILRESVPGSGAWESRGSQPWEDGQMLDTNGNVWTYRGLTASAAHSMNDSICVNDIGRLGQLMQEHGVFLQ